MDSRIKDQPCDVLLGHTGKLVGEYILKADEPHQDPLVGLLVKGVPNDVEFNHASPLLETGGFITCRMSRQQAGLRREGGRYITTMIFLLLSENVLNMCSRCSN